MSMDSPTRMDFINSMDTTGVRSLSRISWFTSSRLVSTKWVMALQRARLHDCSVMGAVSMSLSALALASVTEAHSL